MAKQKFYAVKTGRTPGIYFTWADCKAQVDKFPGAKYKGCESVDEAYQYIETPEEEIVSVSQKQEVESHVPNGPYAFVDGSFNPETKVYGYGGFLDVHGRRFPIMGSGNDPEMASMRNVAGEIEGSMAAVKKAEELGLREMTILYDYKGIEEWATGNWKATKKGTEDYKNFMDPMNRNVQVVFEKVAAHTGIEGNEMADVMAKKAVGIELTGSQQKLLSRALQSGDRSGLDISGVMGERECEEEMSQ